MLSEEQEEKLITVISKYKAAIGWRIDDIKGINREICEHRIFLEEDSKPTRKPQRRLNPHIFEVVKKEILKWLKADFIYAISDSPWVSPVHVVPKKSGTIVIKSEEGEEMQTRIVLGHRVCIDDPPNFSNFVPSNDQYLRYMTDYQYNEVRVDIPMIKEVDDPKEYFNMDKHLHIIYDINLKQF